MKICASLALVSLSLGCEQSPKPERVAPVASAAVADAGDCVVRCVERRQMQARSPEQIEADCRAACVAADR